MNVIEMSIKLIEDGEYEEAVYILTNEIEKDPANPELYCRLNTALSFMQEYEKAEQTTENLGTC